jgi:hypothetical protein
MLTESQKIKLKNIRSDFKTLPCTLWTISKSGNSSTDFYRRAVTITSGSRLFSGAVAWANTIYRKDSQGGFYKTSDVTIVCSYDEKNTLDTNNSYLVCEGVPLRMKSLAQATDTNEIVIYCERLNE